MSNVYGEVMPVMERRLQLLLDQERYERVRPRRSDQGGVLRRGSARRSTCPSQRVIASDERLPRHQLVRAAERARARAEGQGESSSALDEAYASELDWKLGI